MRRAIVFLLTLLCTATAQTAPESAHFQHRLPLIGEIELGGWYLLRIPSEIYTESLEYPRDLRVMDDRGISWPFCFSVPAPPPKWEDLPVRQLNSLRVDEGPAGWLQVDLHLEPSAATDARRIHSRIEVRTVGTDFVRRVELYGSEDQTQWGLLGSGFLIHSREPIQLQVHHLAYPPSNLPFLRLRIFPGRSEAQESLRLLRASPQRQSGRTTELRSVTVTHQLMENSEPGQRSWELDTGFARHPWQALELDLEGRDHLCRVRVFARNRPDEEWQYAGSGDVLRIGSLRRNRLALNARGRYLRVDLTHGDDPPPELQSARALFQPEILIVEARSGRAAYLYTGAVGQHFPSYDLEARLRHAEAGSDFPLLQSGAIEPNPDYQTPRIPTAGPAAATAVIALVSATLLVIIYRMMRK